MKLPRKLKKKLHGTKRRKIIYKRMAQRIFSPNYKGLNYLLNKLENEGNM